MMKILYVPQDFYLIVNNAAKFIAKDYENNTNFHINDPKFFDIVNIIFQMRKDEINISTLFNHDLSDMTIVETQNNYYISMSMYTASRIAYIDFESEFSNLIRKTISNVITNIFNPIAVKKEFEQRNRRSVHVHDYLHRYLDIMDDIYSISKSYINILNHSDLGREDLNKLFKFTTKLLIPIKRVSDLKSFKRINIINNDYNFFGNTIHDNTLITDEYNAAELNISQYLKCISEEDKFTRNNIEVEFKTSIETINNFLLSTFSSYKHTVQNISDILPSTILIDAFISISIEDIVRYSYSNTDIFNIKNILTFKNNYMNFAINKEEYSND